MINVPSEVVDEILPLMTGFALRSDNPSWDDDAARETGGRLNKIFSGILDATGTLCSRETVIRNIWEKLEHEIRRHHERRYTKI